MDEMSIYVKRLFDLHKKKGENNFGSLLDPSQVTKRVEEQNQQRKNHRDELMSKRRQLTTMSPLNSPQVTKPVRQVKKTKPSRFDMLTKWKMEKEKTKLLEKAKRKPIFKVSRVQVPTGLSDLETINRQIKGKPFTTGQFAPVNHEFKPPGNLKPIYFTETGKRTEIEVSNTNKIITRSQTRSTRQGSVPKTLQQKIANKKVLN